MTPEIEIMRDQSRLRKEALIRQVLHSLERTLQVQAINSDASTDDVRVEFTDKSARIIAPLIEAVDILESIIWASDGCVGHRECAHSMEPWQRARALLSGKWQAYEDRRSWP